MEKGKSTIPAWGSGILLRACESYARARMFADNGQNNAALGRHCASYTFLSLIRYARVCSSKVGCAVW